MKQLLKARDMGEVSGALHAAVLDILFEDSAREAPDWPADDDALHAWIRENTGWDIPRVAVCPDHQAPFDFVADMFFYRVSDALVLGPRGGGKTQDSASLHLANGYFKPGHQTSHIGAIQMQAKRCYSYYRRGLRASDELAALAPDPHIESTEWRNTSGIEILPGTEAQTQGGHPHLTAYDEIEQGKYQPYENSKGMSVEYIDVRGVRRAGQWLGTSTRQDGLGMMQSALDDFQRESLPVYTWCAFETVDGTTCSEEGQPLCGSCPLFDAGCGGRALKADGWRSRDEIIRIFVRSGRDTWEAQHLCVKPESQSLVYANWSPANVTVEADWKVIEDEAGDKLPAGPIFVWYDWGFTDDTHFGLLQERGGVFYMFDELTGNQTSERDWVRALAKRICDLDGYDGPSFAEWEKLWSKTEWPREWPIVWPDIIAGDPSAVQLRNELKDHGFPITRPEKIAHKVESGQDVLRSAILTAGGLRRLLVHPRCRVFIKGVSSYRTRRLEDGSFSKLPDPQPANHKFSHPVDGARYLFWTLRKSHLGLEVSDAENAMD